MKKTIEQVIYSVKEQLSGFNVTQDTLFDDLFIHKKLLDIKSVVLKDEYLKTKYLDPSIYTSECCLEIKCNELECDGIKSGDVEYYVDLPAIESFMGEQAIKYFGGMDKKSPFARRSFNGQVFSDFNQFTHTVPSMTRIGDKAILENLPTTGMKFACFIAVIEDPISFCKLTDPFPLPQHLIQQMELLTIKHIASGLAIPPDVKNDSQARTEETVPVKNA